VDGRLGPAVGLFPKRIIRQLLDSKKNFMMNKGGTSCEFLSQYSPR